MNARLKACAAEIAKKMSLGSLDGDDLLHELYLRLASPPKRECDDILRRFSKLDREQRFRYCSKTMKNRARAERRRTARRQALLESYAFLSDRRYAEAEPVTEVAAGEDEQLLRKLFDNLRATVVLPVDGMTRKEQAARLGMKPNALSVEIYRARKRLAVVREHLLDCAVLSNECPDCKKMRLTDGEIRAVHAALVRRYACAERTADAVVQGSGSH